jgi:hypothetical protein
MHVRIGAVSHVVDESYLATEVIIVTLITIDEDVQPPLPHFLSEAHGSAEHQGVNGQSKSG